MVNLQLERVYFAETYTIGNLLVNGTYFCDTLEDKNRDWNKDGDLNDEGELKIFGETAIPYGRYKVSVTMSPKFKRMLPIVHNVLGFDGIRIHRGNTVKDTLGCILVGFNKLKGKLVDSTITEVRLTKLLLDFQNKGEEIYLEIT